MIELSVSTHNRIEVVDITSKVQDVIRKEKLESGVVVVYVPHTTAGVTINENADPSVAADLMKGLSKIAPEGAGYAHLEGNADSHIKSSLVGPSLTVIVENGQLVLGTWQGIYFCEFDGPRSRRCFLKVLKG